MALVIDGIPVSGSIGLKTFSRNRFGNYTRTRTNPVNPNSTRQQAAREGFRNAVSYWVQTMTTINKNLWNTWAANVPWLNAAGQTVNMTGMNAWVRYYCAVWAATGAAPATVTPPSLFNLGQIQADTLVIANDGTDLNVDFNAVVASNSWQAVGGFLLFELSRPTNPGNEFPGGPWYVCEVVDGSAVAAVSFSVPLTSLKYIPADGQIVWARMRGIAPIASDRRVSEQLVVGPVAVA